MNDLSHELEVLTHKIEQNTATITEYHRYELLLKEGGLSSEYIFSYLRRAGFNSWQELVDARKDKEGKKETQNAVAIGGLLGLGLGLLLAGIFGSDNE